MVRISAVTLVALGVLSQSRAETTYIGCYVHGAKFGYMVKTVSHATFKGKRAIKSTSLFDVTAKVLGTESRVRTTSVCYMDLSGRPIFTTDSTESAGRWERTTTEFKANLVNVKIDNNGAITRRIVPIPKGIKIVADPTNFLKLAAGKIGSKTTIYGLNVAESRFDPTIITLKGAKTIKVHGTQMKLQWAEFKDSNSVSSVYLDRTGRWVETVAGSQEMIAEPKALALAKIQPNDEVDVATASKIVPTGACDDLDLASEISLTFKASDMARPPSDDHQTSTKTADGWKIEIHPPNFPDDAGVSIADAAKAQPKWITPDLYIPCDKPRFRTLAKNIVNGETDVVKAARHIQLYVYSLMFYDAAISVMRDANEILTTQRGVCRDYAILTTTLMRAANIPAQLAVGLCGGQSGFYGHAWVLIFDGKNWIGVDSTGPDAQISAAHIELATGSYGQAFDASIPDHPTLTIIDSKQRG